jgi:hypothetical protein
LNQDTTRRPQIGSTPDGSAPETGLVISVDMTGIRVRLASGIVGILAPSSVNGSGQPLELGQRGIFRVYQRRGDGEIELYWISPEEVPSQESFDHDVTRLQQALRDHPPATISHPARPMIPTVDEQKMQGWLRRVDACLDTLKKNRTNRLNQEVRSET